MRRRGRRRWHRGSGLLRGGEAGRRRCFDPRWRDLGCGWGELLLRILDAVPGAVGTGIDLSAADLARGRDNAAARGLASRVSFAEESAVGTARGPADLLRRQPRRSETGARAANTGGSATRVGRWCSRSRGLGHGFGPV